ncbi:McrB family protein [Thiomicrospira cyclica]|uniref:ATPase associated with various cellular activities AAA_5 n=1 Tax=Thiomicrospira cyclica (strain DSM 14477 / JCM 11371 / ALM1) TaxID=717773 RepID=F6DBU3_THICA|nr:AAA family ATPase [Thiomicrospira cyclica]AEG31329.1 ATPase associated with various cellular activities AAA_5 [Thiomicrospira cyclica ALM1]
MTNIKELYEQFKNIQDSCEQFNEFKAIAEFKKENLENLTLEKYTNILSESDDTKYLTWWIERGTDKCGKFRTASSYAYGVYKVNHENTPKVFKSNPKEWQNKAESGYRSVTIKNEPKDKFLKQKEAEEYFNDQIKPKLVSLSKSEDLESFDKGDLQISFCRKVAYLYNPDQLLPIYSKDVILSIAQFLDEQSSDSSTTLKQDVEERLDKIKITVPILNKLKEILEIEKLDFTHTQKLGAFLWHYFGNQVPFAKNTIFYGAPGTGKTFSVVESVKQKIAVEGGCYEMVQFHPSFSYEDFIDGLKPKLAGNNVELKLRNGVFKAFCIKATKALIEFRKASKNQKTEPPKYYFIVDEVNRADLSAVFGEVLSCLEDDKRIDFDEQGHLIKGLTLSTQNSYLIESPDDAVYTDKSGSHLFGIPSNIVFIGTMNDIDRSVDTFDFALRRRFTWIYKGFDEDVLAECEELKNIDTERYIDSCKKLNKFIADDLELGRSYEIGHAYFMKVEVKGKGEQVTKAAKEKLFDRHLSPLIEEYLRSEFSAKDIAQKLKEARSKFVGEG